MKITVLHQEKEIRSLEHTGDYSRLKIRIPDHSGQLQIRFAVPILDALADSLSRVLFRYTA